MPVIGGDDWQNLFFWIGPCRNFHVAQTLDPHRVELCISPDVRRGWTGFVLGETVAAMAPTDQRETYPTEAKTQLEWRVAHQLDSPRCSRALFVKS